MENQFEIPKNKKAINNKYASKDSIKSAIYAALKNAGVEGIYNDDNWQGINKIQQVFKDNNLKYFLEDASYSGHGEMQNTNLPTRKIYRFVIQAQNNKGFHIPLFLKVTCAFVGKTGTMADTEYEVTYYFF